MVYQYSRSRVQRNVEQTQAHDAQHIADKLQRERRVSMGIVALADQSSDMCGGDRLFE